jgi:uncharacterized membrane protein/thiol-disulfide isomerase/thioredoxin
MNYRNSSILTLLLTASLLFTPATAGAQTTEAVVHAVLFYSPTCGHCEYVINEVLPPLMEKYGDQLQIIGIDVIIPEGQELFRSAMQTFNLQSSGVPFLVVGNTYLIGSVDIPEQFPGLIDTHLAQGGLDFPEIPGLRESLELSEPSAPQTAPETDSVSPSAATPTNPASILIDNHNLTWQEKFTRDPAGNTLAVIVLLGMLASLIWVITEFPKKKKPKVNEEQAWIIPILCLLGLGVAGYLTYVETANVTAVCGPVGDCNTVQQSEYARLFGILPIGVLGLAGYITIAIAWMVAKFSKNQLTNWASVSILGFAYLGTLFSAYLTFLEPFVIGATCAWCLTSAVIITLLMLLSIYPAKLALSNLK